MDHEASVDRNSAGQSRLLGSVILAMGLFGTSAAQADVWEIVNVLDGSSGFGASSFHDSSGGSPMSGSTLDEIIEVGGSFGTYDDVSGELNVTGLTLAGGGSFTLTGNLLFPGSTLAPASTVDVDFTGQGASLSDTTIGFMAGYVCCGSTNEDPNSFIVSSSGPGSTGIMSLWGANFTGDFDGLTYPGSTIGMDIRLGMVFDSFSPPATVPVPAAAWLFGSAILGLVAVKRRKT